MVINNFNNDNLHLHLIHQFVFKNFFLLVTEYNYVFLYEGASYSVNYNDSIVVRFAHNNEGIFNNPDFIRSVYRVRIGFFDSPPFQYVIRSGTVPYTGEIYINNIQFSHAGEYRIVHNSYYYVRSQGHYGTFVLTVNSEF